MAVKSYNADEVIIIFGGNIISGYADGTFVTIGRDNDGFGLVIGSNGEGCRSRSNDNSGTCEVTLIQSSASNPILSALHQADELAGGGAVPLLVKDNSGNSLYSAETAWVQKFADSEFGREAGSRVWTIRTDWLNVFVGSNS